MFIFKKCSSIALNRNNYFPTSGAIISVVMYANVDSKKKKKSFYYLLMIFYLFYNLESYCETTVIFYR